MARYVIANRRAGKFNAAEKVAARHFASEAVFALSSASIIEDNDPEDETARRVTVVEADPLEVEQMRSGLPPDVIMEPEILHWPVDFAPPDLISAGPVPATLADAMAPLSRISVLGGGVPLPACRVTIYVRSFGRTEKIEGITGGGGHFDYAVPVGATVSAALIAPHGGYWTMLARGPQLDAPIDCPPLPRGGPVGWWHQLLGATGLESDGRGIRIGVVDSGLADHACLARARRLGAFIGGNIDGDPDSAKDADGHGTHVAGTIGGAAVAAGQYSGMAPGCDILSARVFPPGQGASNADIANAIDALSRDHNVDLINMSLASPSPSEVVHDAIIDAAERGTLCIVAAGNSAGAVQFPAAFPESVAVAALGLAGWGPAGSLSASRLPQSPDRFGHDNLYVANFSCFGAEIDCAGPGVGIVAPAWDPAGGDDLFAGMDGTSMAAPAVCGLLAALLSRNPSFSTLPRSQRAAAARSILNGHMRDAGFGTSLQGRGTPYLS
jgi:subtilisin family serine protease